ncbi:uncharacterized protein LOC143817542 [Ranitomeya variabilis]|uniref:uncharacterized protein LOC143817542 n=1 Tax=Ranitomeya variabilis TaxID=490064 RepID=UPI00405781F6
MWYFSAISGSLDSNTVLTMLESRELYRIMELVRNMERRRLIKPQDILATLQSIPEDESESELQEHVFDSDSDEDFIPQNISSESEDSEGTNPEDIPSTSTGDRAHAVMLPRDHPPGRGQKKSAKRPRNERTTDNDGGEGNATTNTREGESEGILVSADGIQWKPVEIGQHLPGRRDSQNILREAPGPTGYTRRNIIIDSPLSAWLHKRNLALHFGFHGACALLRYFPAFLGPSAFTYFRFMCLTLTRNHSHSYQKDI